MFNSYVTNYQAGYLKKSSCLGQCLGTLYSRWIVHPQLKGHFCHASEASQAGDTPTQGPSQLGLYDDLARVKTKAMFNSYMLAVLYITAISAGSIPITKGLRVLEYWCNQCKSTVLQQQLIFTVLMPH